MCVWKPLPGRRRMILRLQVRKRPDSNVGRAYTAIMNVDSESYYRATASRDERFDGVFFVGVTTTHIYCRPVCPARLPRPDRCRFYHSAAAAERDGFRPCLVCRPELAPGQAPIDALSRNACMILECIGGGALDHGDTLEALAERLGLGSRQLRRVVRRELGVSLVQLAQTHRLLLAKQLLTETHLPVTEVAHSSGFRSLRRFHALFRSRYKLTPTQLRRSPGPTTKEQTVRLVLSYRPPMQWDAMLRFLEARTLPGVESVAGRSYLRTAAIRECRGWLCVQPAVGQPTLQVEVSSTLVPVLAIVLACLKNLFDLSCRPDLIEAHLKQDSRIGPMVRRFPGLRVPGAFSNFELAVRAILGQQVSVQAATTLAGRLAAAFGESIETPYIVLSHLTPSAEAIARAERTALTAIGLTTARAQCIRGLARAVADRRINLNTATDPQRSIRQLMALPGIGSWTAEYIAMRALRWPDAFPATDLGLRKALGGAAQWQVQEMSIAWRPWRAYAVMHLWNSLNQSQSGIGRSPAQRPSTFCM
jgi:AraC family transcriptional regulator of adaptative response / DNA-3-methyladenine glycosylase II